MLRGACVLALGVLVLCGAAMAQTPVDPVIVPIQNFTLLKSSNQSGFYQVRWTSRSSPCR